MLLNAKLTTPAINASCQFAIFAPMFAHMAGIDMTRATRICVYFVMPKRDVGAPTRQKIVLSLSDRSFTSSLVRVALRAQPWLKRAFAYAPRGVPPGRRMSGLT